MYYRVSQKLKRGKFEEVEKNPAECISRIKIFFFQEKPSCHTLALYIIVIIHVCKVNMYALYPVNDVFNKLVS